METAEINTTTLPTLERDLPSYRVSEKQLLLIRAIERKSKFPGAPVTVKPSLDYPLGWAESEQELRYLLNALQARGLVRVREGSPLDMNSIALAVEISADGWDFLEENARSSVVSDQAFVAMSFAEELRPAWEAGIKPALIKAGFLPYRVDSTPHSDRIDWRIITEIKASRFVVADVTQQRPGVYFEAGYAVGLDIPVIWCVRHDDLANVHFDTRQYNHIVWQNEQELADKLFDFTMAIIGHGGRAAQP